MKMQRREGKNICHVYMWTEQGAKITVEPGKIVVECRDGMRRLVPEQTLESIVIFGNVVLTLPAQKRCLEDGISVHDAFHRRTLFRQVGVYFPYECPQAEENRFI